MHCLLMSHKNDANEKQFCDFFLNLGQWFRRICRLKDFLSGALAALLLGILGNPGVTRSITLHLSFMMKGVKRNASPLGKRGCLLGGAEPFVQFYKRAS